MIEVKKMPFEEQKDEEEANIRLLFKSKDDYLFRGVLGGLAEYWNMDSTILRIAFLLLTVITGGLFGIVYFILMKIIPSDS